MSKHATQGPAYEAEAAAWEAVAQASRVIDGGTDTPEDALRQMRDLRDAANRAVRATEKVIAQRQQEGSL